QIGAELIRDFAGRKRRRRDVPALVARVLFGVGAIGLHRPQVHGAVAVADEVHPALVPDRILAGAGVLRGQRLRLVRAVLVLPDGLGGAALVTLRVAALERQTGEEERLALVVITAVGRLGQRHEFAPFALGAQGDADELRVGQRGEVARRVEQL